jgi:glycosyltransferase involved in cell wall biosynthesis
MKILIALHDLSQIGGTQTWAFEVARVLSREHQVDVFCGVNGPFGAYLSTHLDVPIWTAKIPQGAYGMALICQTLPMQVIQHLDTFKVYTQHGPTHLAEQYPGGAHQVVAVSQEVQQVLARRQIESEVITNGVDMRRFHPSNQEPTTDVLNLCKGRRGRDMIETACSRLGLSYKTVHYKDNPEFDVAPWIRQARYVVGYGRCVLEALASGKQALIFDARGDHPPTGAGWATQENIDDLQTTNLNGRNDLIHFTPMLLEEILYEHPAAGAWQRAWASQNADIEDKVRQYLDLFMVSARPRQAVYA